MNQELTTYYSLYNEENRLFRDKTHQIEYITTMHYFNMLFPESARILDVCAGTGNYSFELAKQGYKIVAGDIVPHNVELMKQKQEMNPILQDIYIGSATDLSRFSDDSFDVVLCMGALYHLKDQSEKQFALAECLRVLEPNGLLVAAYISKYALCLINTGDQLDNMDELQRCNEDKSMGLFVGMTPSEIEEMVLQHQVEIVKHVAADGIGYTIRDKINDSSEENFQKWVGMHLDSCEEKSLLGYSLHNLIFAKKSFAV